MLGLEWKGKKASSPSAPPNCSPGGSSGTAGDTEPRPSERYCSKLHSYEGSRMGVGMAAALERGASRTKLAADAAASRLRAVMGRSSGAAPSQAACPIGDALAGSVAHCGRARAARTATTRCRRSRLAAKAVGARGERRPVSSGAPHELRRSELSCPRRARPLPRRPPPPRAGPPSTRRPPGRGPGTASGGRRAARW